MPKLWMLVRAKRRRTAVSPRLGALCKRPRAKVVSQLLAAEHTASIGRVRGVNVLERDVLNQVLYFGLTIAILVSGTLALKMQFALLSKMKATPNDVLRIFVVTLIVTFGLATTAIKDASELKELAPVFGLFGTIAGYLLGSANRSPPKSEKCTKPAEPPSEISN
jgi:hypothetical protein